jgi:hypothetical protein
VRQGPRAQFLELVGHTAAHDVMPSIGDLPAMNCWIFRTQMGQADAAERTCGWWWCSAPEGVTDERWLDLVAAVKVLRKHGVDPWDLKVQQLSYQCVGARNAGEARDDYEDIVKTIDDLTARMTSADGKALCRDLQKTRETASIWAGMARTVKPDIGHRRRDLPIRQALEVGAGWGWKPGVVAAALYLCGVDRGTWTSFKDATVKKYAESPPQQHP